MVRLTMRAGSIDALTNAGWMDASRADWPSKLRYGECGGDYGE